MRIDLIPAGDNVPESLNVLIEVPIGGEPVKYEFDKASGALFVDRFLHTPMRYPANYGFIPQTYCGDRDPLDILVISQVKIETMCVVESKVIGVMQMLDGGEADDKIIAVCAGDPSIRHINDISELPPHTLAELRNFFEDYKKLENKTVVIDNFLGREDALRIVKESYEFYDETFR